MTASQKQDKALLVAYLFCYCCSVMASFGLADENEILSVQDFLNSLCSWSGKV